MNYYPFHIGDFHRSTRFCTPLERNLYRTMLDLYYETEQPLPLELKILMRRVIAITPDEVAAVEQLLSDFFTETADGWMNARCEQEIAEAKAIAMLDGKDDDTCELGEKS